MDGNRTVGDSGQGAHAWTSSRFARFCAVGGTAAGTSVFLLHLLVDVVGLHYLAAYAITFVVMNAGAYVVSRRVVFGTTRVDPASGLLRYFFVTSFGLLATSSAMVYLVDMVGLGHIAAALTVAVIQAPINYLLHKQVTFGIRHDAIAEMASHCCGTPGDKAER